MDCETYGLAKDYTGQRGYHPLLAIAAGTGDVLMSRLREGRANTAGRLSETQVSARAQSYRGHTGGGLDAHTLLAGRRRRCGYTPFQSEPDAAPVRLIVRRVQPTPGSQLALFATYSRLHHRPGGGNPGTGSRPSPPRRDRELLLLFNAGKSFLSGLLGRRSF